MFDIPNILLVPTQQFCFDMRSWRREEREEKMRGRERICMF